MNSLEQLAGQLTLNDLAERSGRTVNQIVAFAMETPVRVGDHPVKTSTPRAVATSPRKAPTRPAKVNAPDIGLVTEPVNTRTPAARLAYDESVLEELKRRGDWTSAAELRAAVGGTPLQIRTSLERLLESAEVDYKGKARATKYRFVG